MDIELKYNGDHIILYCWDHIHGNDLILKIISDDDVFCIEGDKEISTNLFEELASWYRKMQSYD